MADYTDLPDTAVGIGGIPSGTTVTALRDNPIAISEGAVGAPKIADAALDTGAATTEGTTWVLLRTAGASLGAVGTYALIRYAIAGTPPATSAGSNLRLANAAGDTGATPSGTWRLMGLGTDGTAAQETSVWLRIA